MKVGIIGFGRLGKLLTRYLAQDFDVFVYERFSLDEQEMKALGATPASLEEVCKSAIILPMVPIGQFEELLKEISPLVSPGTLVADVCSVKELPIQWMKKHLPEDIQILGTHPMFGPDSARDTLFGSKLVLTPVRIDDKLLRDITLYLERVGIKVIEASAEKHDKEIAHSLLLSHYIGQALIAFQAKPLEIDTKGFRRLIKILETVENDSFELFVDMNKYNPYAEETMSTFFKCLSDIKGKVHQ